MNEQVNRLCATLHFETKFKATHDFEGQVLPFFTREPERVKYTNGFNPVIGVIARVINGQGEELEQTEMTSQRLALETTVDPEIVDQLFSPEVYREMPSSKLLQYLPLSEGQERAGEIRLGEFLIDLLGLQENTQFIKNFSENEPDNLYERVVLDSLRASGKTKKTSARHFEFYDQPYYQTIFSQDVNRLMADKSYFYDHISDLLAFYYFTYVTQTIARVSDTQVKAPIIPLYFALEDESVSRSRQAVRVGYGVVYQHSQDLLIDVDILNYLNALIPDEKFYWRNQIMAPDFDYRTVLYDNLMAFLPLLVAQLDETVTAGIDIRATDLTAAVASLRELLVRRNEKSRAASSRYAKSFTAIAQQGFVRQHGRLGRTFSLNKETILMLTAAIVGNQKKPLNEVFTALEKRGIFFDRITRDKVVTLYEQANILEKLSDSGDAQYVRGIL